MGSLAGSMIFAPTMTHTHTATHVDGNYLGNYLFLGHQLEPKATGQIVTLEFL